MGIVDSFVDGVKGVFGFGSGSQRTSSSATPSPVDHTISEQHPIHGEGKKSKGLFSSLPGGGGPLTWLAGMMVAATMMISPPIAALLGAVLFGPALMKGIGSLFSSSGDGNDSEQRTVSGGGAGGSSPSLASSSPERAAGTTVAVAGAKTEETGLFTQITDTADRYYNRGKVFWKTHTNSESKLRAIDAVDFLKDSGLTEAQAIGIAANLTAESNLQTTAIGDGKKSHGVAQWNGSRLEDYKKLYGHALNDPSISEGQKWYEQLNFIVHELNHKEKAAGNALRKAKTPEEAAAIFSRTFERPTETEAEAGKRAGIATQIAGAYNNKSQMAALTAGVDKHGVTGGETSTHPTTASHPTTVAATKPGYITL